MDMRLEVVVVPALRRAAAAHGKHEEEIGHADPDSTGWYAEYMVRERAAGGTAQ